MFFFFNLFVSSRYKVTSSTQCFVVIVTPSFLTVRTETEIRCSIRPVSYASINSFFFFFALTSLTPFFVVGVVG